MANHIKIYTSEVYKNHDTGQSHPERPARIETLLDLFTNSAPYNTIKHAEFSPAKREDIIKVHSSALYYKVDEAAPTDIGSYEFLDNDTILSAGSYDAAHTAVGAVIQAVEDIYNQDTKIALCAHRPPGHHATYDQSMGFCIFNNAMAGVARAAELGFKKIAVIDFDVHHGNGCQDIILNIDLPCFYISSHQAEHYPGTGFEEENIPGKLLNKPLPTGSDGVFMRKVYDDDIFPALDAYGPDLIFICAGFDAHKDDPYGGLNWEDEDYYWLTSEIYKIALKHSKGRVISCLEGGYDLDALKNSYARHIDAFLKD